MTNSTELTITPTLIDIQNGPQNRHLLSIPKGLLKTPLKNYIKSGINPLIDSAALLFMFANRIHTFPSAPSIAQLSQYLSHELHRYEKSLLEQGFDETTATHCSYVLAFMLESMIHSAPWGAKIKLENHHLSKEWLQVSNDSLKKFIDIAISSRALDTIEFLYTSMALGFNHPSLNTAILQEKLYRIILAHGRQKKLSLLSPSLSPEKLVTPELRANSPKMFLLIAAIAFFTIFSALNYFISITTHQATTQARVVLASTTAGTPL